MEETHAAASDGSASSFCLSPPLSVFSVLPLMSTLDNDMPFEGVRILDGKTLRLGSTASPNDQKGKASRDLVIYRDEDFFTRRRRRRDTGDVGTEPRQSVRYTHYEVARTAYSRERLRWQRANKASRWRGQVTHRRKKSRCREQKSQQEASKTVEEKDRSWV